MIKIFRNSEEGAKKGDVNIEEVKRQQAKARIIKFLCILIVVSSISYYIGYDSANRETLTTYVSEEKSYSSSNRELIGFNPIASLFEWLEKNEIDCATLIDQVASSSRYGEQFADLKNHLAVDKEDIKNVLEGQKVMTKETLYIGDSRTQGLLISGALEEDKTVYGVGYGYNWLIGRGEFSSKKSNATSGGIAGLKSKMDKDKPYNIVIWLGVNDLKRVSASKYFEVYKDLATGEWKNHDLYIVSVGPVNDAKSHYVRNADIDSFNASMQELIGGSQLKNLHYVDLGLSQKDIKRFDNAGIHYSRQDSQNIASLVADEIARVDLERQADLIELFYDAISYIEELKNHIIFERTKPIEYQLKKNRE